jgi:hypothetical protein
VISQESRCDEIGLFNCLSSAPSSLHCKFGSLVSKTELVAELVEQRLEQFTVLPLRV